MPRRAVAVTLLISALLLLLILFMFASRAPRPASLGVKNGQLSPCPPSPNCVCSQGADPAHFIEPLRYKKSPAEAMADLKQVLARQKRVTIIATNDSYLYAEFRSQRFRFVDDVEFLIETNGVIQVRSASRVGHSDLGVNRKRIESLRRQFER
jgi:uncharacterized protein (DUF1499 family)